MITEKELYDWLRPIAKWGDILTCDVDIFLVNDTPLGFELNGKSGKTYFLSTSRDSPYEWKWANLRLWRCTELPYYLAYEPNLTYFGQWQSISTYPPPKEETVTMRCVDKESFDGTESLEIVGRRIFFAGVKWRDENPLLGECPPGYKMLYRDDKEIILQVVDLPKKEQKDG